MPVVSRSRSVWIARSHIPRIKNLHFRRTSAAEKADLYAVPARRPDALGDALPAICIDFHDGSIQVDAQLQRLVFPQLE